MKNENQAQKRSIGSNALIIVLILIILATSAFGIFAWARYQSSVQGESTAQVAKWSFKVNGNGTQTEQVSFLMTRTDSNNTVATGTMAPGTYGEIPITIDVTGTQTDLVYTISGSIGNLPRNIKLYFDAARTQEMVMAGQSFSKGNYLKVADIGTESKVISETIYWEWPFETGETEEAIEINNQEDTEDMGKTMTMVLKVEGKQLNDEPVLADVVQVGDYVNYNASNGNEGVRTFTNADYANILDENKSGTISLSETISTQNEFNSEAKAQWRVLSVDRESKQVELISVAPIAQKVTLSGRNGFENAETVLNNIGSIYGQGKGGNGGRSINIEDIEKISSFDPYSHKNTNSNTGRYGGTINYTTGKFYEEVKDENGKVIGYNSTINQATPEQTVEVTQTNYHFNASSYIKSSIMYDMIINITNNESEYWLASRCVDLAPTLCGYGVRRITKNGLRYHFVTNSVNDVGIPAFKVVPIVNLDLNIQTTGQENGVWQLKID